MSSQHQAELHKKLWAIANSLRANSGIESFEFKNYILGIIFYKFLSENTEDYVAELLSDDDTTFQEAWSDDAFRADLTAELLEKKGYVVAPEFLFSTLVAEINKGSSGNFDVELLQEAINHITQSTRGTASEDDFDHLFDDMDLNSSRLGKDVKTRSEFMAKVLTHVDELSFRHDDVEIDVLGDAYEYMIGNFAASAGKKAGEFYTPQQVSKILAKIVTNGKDRVREVYDPTCGSGSLLLRVANEAKVGKYYGQELTSTTYNLARMNMMLHGIPYQRFDIRNGNTLTEDLHEGKTFEAIVANPPYSAHWQHTIALQQDDRFSGYGKLAPTTKADFAFVQHMIHHLADDGAMAVVLPHGVLFRGGAEEVIRKQLVEKNYLDAVIGLPANIFFGTSIPTVVLVFKKNREAQDILFIDASKEFMKGKNQNSLSDEHVNNILEAYMFTNKFDENYARKVLLSEIIENDYNLNISRYIHSEISSEIVSLDLVEQQLSSTITKLSILEEQINISIRKLDPAYRAETLGAEKILELFRDRLDTVESNKDAPDGSILINFIPDNFLRGDNPVAIFAKGSVSDIGLANRSTPVVEHLPTFILTTEVGRLQYKNFLPTVEKALQRKLGLSLIEHPDIKEDTLYLVVSADEGLGIKL